MALELSTLNIKEPWLDDSLQGVQRIAMTYGYEPDRNFITALETYRGIVEAAKITTALQAVAVCYFGNWSPPLTRRNEQ